MQTRTRLRSLLIIGALAVISSAQAAFLVQPGGSIQDALDTAAASPGPDVVLLHSGVYQENFTIDDPNSVKLQGTGDVILQTENADAPKDIIRVRGGHVTIQNLTILGGDDGIDAEDAESLTLVNVNASDNEDEGVGVEGVGFVVIRNSDFLGNGGDGIAVEDAGSVLLINVTAINNDDGVDLEDVGTAELRHVVLNENDDEGLEVDDTDSVLVTFGEFHENEGEGLDLDDTREIVLVSVSSRRNDGSGLQVNAESVDTEQVTIVAGEFSENGEDGLQFIEEDGAIGDVTLTSVVARDNIESGLDISASGTLIQRRVISENNGEADQLP